MKSSWGIVLEWDEDGLECCQWLTFASRRLDFTSPSQAQWYIDHLSHCEYDRDVAIRVQEHRE